MNWKRFFRVVLKFSALGFLVACLLGENPEEALAQWIALAVLWAVPFAFIGVAFNYFPDFIKKPAKKKAKEKWQKSNLMGRFWRFMIR